MTENKIKLYVPVALFCSKVESGCKPLYDYAPLRVHKLSWPLNCSQYANGDNTGRLKQSDFSDESKQYERRKKVQGGKYSMTYIGFNTFPSLLSETRQNDFKRKKKSAILKQFLLAIFFLQNNNICIKKE